MSNYVIVKRPDITNNKRGYIAEHRAVWIDAHGTIPPGAVIHHKNNVKDDNILDNLELYCTNAEHRRRCHSTPIQGKTIDMFNDEDMEFVRLHLPVDHRTH